MSFLNQVVDRCASTNDLARELGEQGAAHGSWVSARIQEKGRGRLGREWQSLEGNLFLSIVVRLEDKSRWTWVPLSTAVAVIRLLEKRNPKLQTRIKWPNDLWIVEEGSGAGAPGSKLGGILCEAVGNRAGSFIIIGLGLNCMHAPEGLDQRTISLSAALGHEVSADDIRAELIRTVVDTVDELAHAGPAGIVRDFERRAAFPEGAPIEWVLPGDPKQAAKQGRVSGLGPSGELIVRLDDETELKLYAEDVRVRSARC